jgi:hypothetical protein
MTLQGRFPPQYDYSNAAVEQTFCDKILHLMKEVGG